MISITSLKVSLFALAALTLSVTAKPVTAPTTDCAAVHVITARASTELPGEGIIGLVVSDIVLQSKQTVTREAIIYPATLTDYANSQSQGVAAMKSRLAAKTSACPGTKIVLMGYSQGAHVAGDVLAAKAPGSSNVFAAILMGDPAHARGESFQKGTGNAQDGLFPRANGILEPFASQISSFCDVGDVYCAGGKDPIVHLVYVQKYGSVSTEFVLDRVGG
ncbi:hypothetical protein H0H81_011644 [Sphagnurus paluster]|uniref:Cutinase n=1 Tax=Sphagnurus paluster TaxID=117069 RepID=A0A9P7GPA9_9AGAR|nr:hypothetical protein H0H81_011644 [Sphagnurus paluster]